VFVRVWEYEVPGDRAAAFTTACAADVAWGELFGRAAGFLDTELYRDTGRADRFLTIDRWQNEGDWQSFLHAFGAAYESLDAQLEGLGGGLASGSCTTIQPPGRTRPAIRPSVHAGSAWCIRNARVKARSNGPFSVAASSS